MAGAARARGLAPGRGQSRWTGEFSASTSGENSRSSYSFLLEGGDVAAGAAHLSAEATKWQRLIRERGIRFEG